MELLELIHTADIHAEADSFTFQAPSNLDTELITTNNIFPAIFFLPDNNPKKC